MRFRYGLLIALVTVAGCQKAVKPDYTVPKTVTVVVKQYIPIPSELTAHCTKAMPQDKTVKEAVRVARSRGASLDNCNAQLDKIVNLPAPATSVP